MCGCQAHHAATEVCTCWCDPKRHIRPWSALHEQQLRWDDAHAPEGKNKLPRPEWAPAERPTGDHSPWDPDREEEPVPPWWARKLGLDFHSDDDSILQRDFYSRQVNSPEGYVCDELTLTYASWSWALGLEFERPDSDLASHQWSGVTLRFGPFSLTASRQKGSL